MVTETYVKIISCMVTLRKRKGQTLVEYGLILALVSIVVIAVLSLMGNTLKTMFSTITTALNTNPM